MPQLLQELLVTGVFMDKDGNFRVGNASGNRLTFTGTSLELVTDDLNIDTSTFDLSTDGTGKIHLVLHHRQVYQVVQVSSWMVLVTF